MLVQQLHVAWRVKAGMNSLLLTSTRCTRFNSSFLVIASRSKVSWNKRTRIVAFTRYVHNGAAPQRDVEATPKTDVDVVAINKTWVDRLPTRIRPYLYLTRIDKPIGTVLLFLPCSAFSPLLQSNKIHKINDVAV